MTQNRVEHVNVLIVGAGLSGVGAARHLQDAFPRRSYLIVEARDAMGGTWDLFRYPGIRSDSDMHTLGYRFRPWTDAKAIADGPSILQYIRDTATEAGIDQRIRYGLKVTTASWSTPDARWTVEATRADGSTATFTCDFLYNCSGYYRYDAGYTPDFPGIDSFAGTVVHPQQWPEDLDYAGKRVVIIGSGATAVTLLPAMTDKAAHVTMLQRSPSYVLPLPGEDRIANGLRKVLGDRPSYAIARWKNVFRQIALFQVSQRYPEFTRRLIRKVAVNALPDGYDVDTHFKPEYGPWDQRLCVVPDGDLFKVLTEGTADIVTDHIETFDKTGITLRSGTHLDADVVVTATGLDLLLFGGVEFVIDGVRKPVPETLAYKGMMLSDVPNFAFTIGYTNSSWTLKADLVAEYVVRLLRHMDETGNDIAYPTNDDPDLETRPLVDFAAGYIQRARDLFPQAATRKPWTLGMHYPADLVTLRHKPLEDSAMVFASSSKVATLPKTPTRVA
jgi:cation diffusion facilitator CzcD-associated flavoprotein CzcO